MKKPLKKDIAKTNFEKELLGYIVEIQKRYSRHNRKKETQKILEEFNASPFTSRLPSVREICQALESDINSDNPWEKMEAEFADHLRRQDDDLENTDSQEILDAAKELAVLRATQDAFDFSNTLENYAPRVEVLLAFAKIIEWEKDLERIQHSSIGGNTRAEYYKVQREHVLAEWEKVASENTKKTEFSKKMHKALIELFPDFVKLGVIANAKTIEEDWLPKTGRYNKTKK